MKILLSLKNKPKRELLVAQELIREFGYSIDVCNYLERYAFETNNYIQKNEIPIGRQLSFVKFSKEYILPVDINKEICDIERALDISIIDVLNADKSFKNITPSDRLNKIYLLFKFFQFIKLEKYDYTLQELSSSADLLMYAYMKKFNKNPISYWHGRYNNKIEFVDLEGRRLGLRKKYNHYKRLGTYNREDIDLYNKLVSDIENPSYMQYSTKHIPLKEFVKSLLPTKSKFKYFWDDKKYSIDSDKSIKVKFDRLNRVFYKIRLNLTKKYISKIYPTKFILFPEQYIPEASTMTFSPYYYEQLCVIENARRNLPFQYSLVVKLHPAMDSRRSSEFIKKLSNFNNIVISRQNNLQLIKNCSGLITLTSTMGWEALLLDKPVFLLGNVFYKEFDHIHKLSDFTMLREMDLTLQRWLSKITTPDYLENKKAFILSSYYSLYTGNMNSIKDPTILKKTNISNISQSIQSFINDYC